VAVAKQPEYLVERMLRGDTTYMRITARGYGLSPRTEVVLQTYFRPYSD
jgi:type IV pilus assembly protein PilX